MKITFKNLDVIFLVLSNSKTQDFLFLCAFGFDIFFILEKEINVFALEQM